MDNSASKPYNDHIDLRRFFRAVKRLKWIYLGCFILFMGLAAVYCVIKQPQYEVKATLLIEDSGSEGNFNGAGGMANMMRTFSIGGFGGSSANNELQLINSHDVLLATAKTLGLNRNYVERDGLSKRMLFLDSPIAVEAPQEMLDTLTAAMKIRVEIRGDKADITVKRGMLGHTVAERKDVMLPATVDTPYGPLQVLRTAAWTGAPATIDVSLGSYESAADYLYTDISVDMPDKLADAISFEFLYPNRERGRAILNTIMAEYNAKRLERTHTNARTRLEFLDGRINALFGELTEAEKKIEEFKARNKIVDIAGEAPLLLQNSLSVRAEMVKAQAETAYYREVLSTLRTPSRSDELLPVFDNEAYPMIKDYNDMIIAKKDLERSARPTNPVMVTAEENLAGTRASVIRNIEGLLKASETLLESQSALAGKSDSRLNSLPAAERDYVMLERDRQLKNDLYAFLASQRESAMLQLYNQSTLGFVVDEAYTSVKPSRRKAVLVCGACLIMALFCPTLLAIWLTWRDRRITGVMDLASLGIESRAIAVDTTDRASANALRTLVTDCGPSTVLYISGNASGQAATSLAATFGAIGHDTELLRPSDTGLPADNDSLSLPAFRRRIADIRGIRPSALVMVEVPDPDRLPELAPLLADNGDSRLLLAYTPGAITVPRVASLLKGIDRASVLYAIVG